MVGVSTSLYRTRSELGPRKRSRNSKFVYVFPSRGIEADRASEASPSEGKRVFAAKLARRPSMTGQTVRPVSQLMMEEFVQQVFEDHSPFLADSQESCEAQTDCSRRQSLELLYDSDSSQDSWASFSADAVENEPLDLENSVFKMPRLQLGDSFDNEQDFVTSFFDKSWI